MVEKINRRSPLFPVLLSALVAPGAGQLANKDFAKGFFLLAVSIGSFIWFTYVVTIRLSTLLPGTPDQWNADPAALKEAITQLITNNSDMFFTFQILILAVWIYGVADAYFSARRKPPPAPTSDETPHADAE